MIRTGSTTVTEQCGVLTSAAKVANVLDLLRSLPMDWPEPSVNAYSELPAIVTWTTDEGTARRIIAFIGCNGFLVHTYDDDPQTIASRCLNQTRDAHDIRVTVVVDGVNLPDLADEQVSA